MIHSLFLINSAGYVVLIVAQLHDYKNLLFDIDRFDWTLSESILDPRPNRMHKMQRGRPIRELTWKIFFKIEHFRNVRNKTHEVQQHQSYPDSNISHNHNHEQTINWWYFRDWDDISDTEHWKIFSIVVTDLSKLSSKSLIAI